MYIIGNTIYFCILEAPRTLFIFARVGAICLYLMFNRLICQQYNYIYGLFMPCIVLYCIVLYCIYYSDSYTYI